MKLAKKGIVSVIFALFMQTALAQTPSLPSMKFGEQASLTTPSNAFAYYTSSSTHTEGHGAGRHEELQALARALDYDAERIFNYVRVFIEYYLTFGLGKGSLGAECD